MENNLQVEKLKLFLIFIIFFHFYNAVILIVLVIVCIPVLIVSSWSVFDKVEPTTTQSPT